ncbi:hypothetical protein DMH17_12140 [Raoultella planticola]|nr:hypothetical protein [Raoultella planticola]
MRVENRRFYAEKMGEIVTASGRELRDLMNYDFTAQMEDRLDPKPSRVASGTGPLLR